MRNLLVIVNPVAGKGKTVEMLPQLSQFFGQHQETIKTKIVISKQKGDITAKAKKHYHLGYREFIAVGGDGTLSELINAFDFEKTKDITIGIIPYGSGNDFIKTMYQSYNLSNLLMSIVSNQTKVIDIGCVNKYNYINSCTFGIDGPIIQTTDKLKKRMPGSLAYLMSTLYAGSFFKAQEVKVTIDEKVYFGKILIMAANNGKYIGGGMNICPQAELDSQYLEICLIKDISKMKFLKNVNKIYQGRLNEIPEVKYLRCKKAAIEVLNNEKQYIINTDGNLVGETPAEIKIIEKAVHFYDIKE